MVRLDEVYRHLAGRQAAMVEELGAYVSIESGSRDKEGVDRAGAALAEAFAGIGFDVQRIPETDCGDHLVARMRGSGRGNLLALIHLDTVWPRGTLSENPFRVEDGRAYGPGVLDMKGGWVVLLSALRALRHVGWDALGTVTVFMTGDEELGSPRGRPWTEQEARTADWALVMEPARESGALVVERGMVGAVYLDIEGATAHAVYPERGASAIREAAHKVLALEDLASPEQGVLVNVGTISGGSARQVIPDRASIAVDLRAPTRDLADKLIEDVHAVAAAQHVPGTHTVLRGGITRPAFERTPGTMKLFELARDLGQHLGLRLDAAGTRAGSDGNFTAALGVPTLDGLGPEGANACSRDEYVLVDSLPRRAALLAGIIAGLPDLAGQDS